MALPVYFLIKNFLVLNSIRKQHSNPLLFSVVQIFSASNFFQISFIRISDNLLIDKKKLWKFNCKLLLSNVQFHHYVEKSFAFIPTFHYAIAFYSHNFNWVFIRAIVFKTRKSCQYPNIKSKKRWLNLRKYYILLGSNKCFY